jgi:hypothetical protein
MCTGTGIGFPLFANYRIKAVSMKKLSGKRLRMNMDGYLQSKIIQFIRDTTGKKKTLA